MSYGTTYMWDLKSSTNELVYKTEIDSQEKGMVNKGDGGRIKIINKHIDVALMSSCPLCLPQSSPRKDVRFPLGSGSYVPLGSAVSLCSVHFSLQAFTVSAHTSLF